MTNPASPAAFPPQGLPGLDAQWSRLIATPDLDEGRTWHVLDNQVEDPRVTLLCLHGNPTWSYLWRSLIASAPDDVRVIAVDHLDMGFSERTGTVRRMARRIDDLCALTGQLGLKGPVVTVAHDWGGPISLGWGERYEGQLVGVVLMNTAVHQPAGARAPWLIRLVRTRGILRTVCETTPMFIRGTMKLGRPRPDKRIRRAYEAPYRTAERRSAIAAFVQDIPLETTHPTHDALVRVAEDLGGMRDTPVLLLWGPSDPVFSELYLRDLSDRLPHAEIHRFVGKSHLLPEDADISSAIYPWIDSINHALKSPPSSGEREPLWASLDQRADDSEAAIVEMSASGQQATITFAELHASVSDVAAGLADLGVIKGDRIGMLVPPGINLAVCIFAAWRMGAVVVLVDAGLGLKGMGRALKSADPVFLMGIPKALAAARILGWPGRRISTDAVSSQQTRMLGVVSTLAELRVRGRASQDPPAPSASDVAAIGFTSGATGPAKGVVYRHHQLQAQRDAIKKLYGISSSDRLVAAFGPFALLGTLMGITSVVPDMKVTEPGSLTAAALQDAVHSVEATLVFASPAALRNVVATQDQMDDAQAYDMGRVRLLLSAGAPVPASVLRAAQELLPKAEAHTPYGMTEVMPVADISLDEIESAGAGEGVCVGRPVEGVDVAISALDEGGLPTGELTKDDSIVGEVCVRAAHMRDGYDKLWATGNAASQPEGWHRTGDVGHFDGEGLLWIEGRLGHVVSTALGPITPIGIEHAVGNLAEVSLAAVVGVGPAGVQQIVVVVVPSGGTKRTNVADEDLSDKVRAEAGRVDVAAVFVTPSLPVDRRHNSKIDRTRISRWAEGVLTGGRMGKI